MTPHPLLRLACFASELCVRQSAAASEKVVELYKREDDIPEDGAE
jgi:hypothetical protein